MRVVAAHEHQQAVLFGHVHDVGDGHNAVPVFRHDLQLGGHLNRLVTVQQAHAVRLPCIGGFGGFGLCGPGKGEEQTGDFQGQWAHGVILLGGTS